MKTYRNAIAALVLAFVFSTSATGEGIIYTEKTLPPPPPLTNGVIHTDASTPEGDVLTEIALNLLQNLLRLL